MVRQSYLSEFERREYCPCGAIIPKKLKSGCKMHSSLCRGAKGVSRYGFEDDDEKWDDLDSGSAGEPSDKSMVQAEKSGRMNEVKYCGYYPSFKSLLKAFGTKRVGKTLSVAARRKSRPSWSSLP